MSTIFETTGNVSSEDLNALLADELARRRAINTGLGATPPIAQLGKAQIHKSLLNELTGEFEDIRSNPALREKNFDQMVRTYEKYLEQGNGNSESVFRFVCLPLETH